MLIRSSLVRPTSTPGRVQSKACRVNPGNFAPGPMAAPVFRSPPPREAENRECADRDRIQPYASHNMGVREMLGGPPVDRPVWILVQRLRGQKLPKGPPPIEMGIAVTSLRETSRP